MQQVVPNPECNTTSGTIASNHDLPRWNRVPRVQPLRNEDDQRVPLYCDQTVPVWLLEENVRAAGAGGSRRELLQHHSHGVRKGARKWADINETEWFRNTREILRASGPQSHAFNVSEILQCCSISSSKWSGIEQDLFTCTAFVSKDFLVPTYVDFIANKKSKMTSNPFL